MSDFIKYLPVGNGDCILIKSGDKTVLTDIKYRTSSEDSYDIAPDIKDACSNNKLSLFISTHQDQDHVLGFAELFHCGKPENWKQSDDKLLINEIVCTDRALNEEGTEASKAIINEIQRRHKLTGDTKSKDGNRLIVVSEGDELSIDNKLSGIVLAPNSEEVNGESRNNSSIVIQWTYQSSSTATKSKILLGGDAECEVWERLDGDYEIEHLEWSLCTAPHHCSMTPLGAKEDRTVKGGKYIDNDKAISALSNKVGNAFVVSSSKEIKRNDDNPPHYQAKGKWIKIIENSADDDASSRFFCTSTHNDGKEAPVAFTLNDKGIHLEKKKTSQTKRAALSSTTKYGCM
ncbi:hypothetical protein AB6E16_17380 [Vibrio atlanticus]|nr:hypothetical protein [Vibrio lentus]MCC4858841.1 hypothetical protein [Vibrio lentus]